MKRRLFLKTPILKITRVDNSGVVAQLKRIADSLELIVGLQYGVTNEDVTQAKLEAAKEVSVADVEAGAYETDDDKIAIEEIKAQLKGVPLE